MSEEETERSEKAVIEPPLKDMELNSQWTLWYSRRNTGQKTDYEKSIKMIGTISTVAEFWNYYSHIVRPNDSPNNSDYHFFKQGIKPMWEDNANKFGGKWIVRLRKGLASRAWEELVLALVGEQFDSGNDICGAVVSLRYQEDILALWNRSADDRQGNLRIRDGLKRVLHYLPGAFPLEYKAHDMSLKDNSSFRNTSTAIL